MCVCMIFVCMYIVCGRVSHADDDNDDVGNAAGDNDDYGCYDSKGGSKDVFMNTIVVFTIITLVMMALLLLPLYVIVVVAIVAALPHRRRVGRPWRPHLAACCASWPAPPGASWVRPERPAWWRGRHREACRGRHGTDAASQRKKDTHNYEECAWNYIRGAACQRSRGHHKEIFIY